MVGIGLNKAPKKANCRCVALRYRAVVYRTMGTNIRDYLDDEKTKHDNSPGHGGFPRHHDKSVVHGIIQK